MSSCLRILWLGLGVWLTTTSAKAYVVISNSGKAARWPTGIVNYEYRNLASGFFTGGFDHSGTASDDYEPIDAGFQAWLDAASGAGFSTTLVFNRQAFRNSAAISGDATNTISWVPSGWKQLSFRPPTNALAVTLITFNSSTGAISDADIYFNSDQGGDAYGFRWAVVDAGSESSYIDVQNIASHEIGHLLGIDHSSESLFETDDELADATMFYASGANETSRRIPQTDDLRAARALYGSTALPAASISSAEIVSTSLNRVTFEVLGSNLSLQTSFILTAGNSSCDDAVSRYRTVQGDGSIRVEFTTPTCLGGSLNLVAFNSIDTIVQKAVNVTGNGYAATSSGGGGCAMGSESSNLSIAWMIFMLGLAALIFAIRLIAVNESHFRTPQKKSV